MSHPSPPSGWRLAVDEYEVTVFRQSSEYGEVSCGILYLSAADIADLQRRLSDDDD